MSWPESKILITGGNGFIGSHAVDALAGQGCKLRCLVRKNSKLDYIQKHVDSGAVELAYGDITDKESLGKALEGMEIVYHFVALAGKQNIPKEEYQKVNYQGTVDLVDLAIKHKIKRFIYCSSVGVMGNIKKIPADETAPYSPTNEYERTKMEAEKYILAKVKEVNFPAVIIRPAIVYGPRNISNMSRMFKAIKEQGFKFFIIGSGKNYWHMSYATDIAQGFVLAGQKSGIEGRIYILAGPRPITMNELTRTAAEILRVKPPFHLPTWLIMPLAVIFSIVKKLAGIKVPLEPSGVKFLTNHRAYTIAKAERELGYHPEVNLKEGLEKTLQWYGENKVL